MRLQHVLLVSFVVLTWPIAALAVEERVTDPALVPQGPAGAITFTTESWLPNQYSATDSLNVYTIQPDGTFLRPFTGPGNRVGGSKNSKFSPDGKWLYFQSNATGHWAIYRGAVDGSATYNVTAGNPALDPDTYGFNFASSPNPSMPQMVFTSQTASGSSRVGVANLDGGNAKVVNPGLGFYYMASLNPKGTEIVFSRASDNYTLNRMTSDGTNTVSLAPSLTQSYVGQYTPDGQQIVFLNTNGDIYRIGRDGSNLARLTTGNKYVHFYISSTTGALPANPDERHGTDGPSISPDGNKIAYVSKGGSATGIPEVYLMNMDGTHQRKLTNLPLACGRVEWSPGGDQLAFASFDSTNHSQLFVMDLNGGAPKQLTHFTDRSVNFIDWSPLPNAGISFIPGDINADSLVNLVDYEALKNHWLQSTVLGTSDGDLDGNGVVNILDFAAFKQAYIARNPGAGASLGPVPEPSTFDLLIVGSCFLIGGAITRHICVTGADRCPAAGPARILDRVRARLTRQRLPRV
jgi:TolB protein